MTAPTRQSLAERVRKLRALAADPAAGAPEAEAAAALAAELMARYALAAEDVDGPAGGVGAHGLAERLVWRGVRPPPESQAVATILARHYACQVMSQQSRAGRRPVRTEILLLARPWGIELAVWVWQFLTAELRRRWRAIPAYAPVRSRRDFYRGVASGLSERLEELARARAAAASPGPEACQAARAEAALARTSASLDADVRAAKPAAVDGRPPREGGDVVSALYGVQVGRTIELARPLPGGEGVSCP